MEELLVILCQFFFEVVLQVLAELPWELITTKRKSADPDGHSAWIFVSLIFGGGVGALSLVPFPTTLLHTSAARLANLLAAPAFSAIVSYQMTRTFRAGTASSPKWRALFAACFTFALALSRFTYATRPHS